MGVRNSQKDVYAFTHFARIEYITLSGHFELIMEISPHLSRQSVRSCTLAQCVS